MTESATATDDRPRILAVDDDPGLLHVISRILGRQHEVRCCQSPTQACLDARTYRPDLVLVDIYMPEMSGFDLMRKLQEGCGSPDVIVMTGDTAEPDSNLIRAIGEGAFYFIQKPFDRRVLQTLVDRCLEARRLRMDKQRQLRRMQRELEEARQFQQSFLPPSRAELAGVRISTRYHACQELAGDYFDYADAGNGHVAALVADVVGHGASAAMMTAVVKTAFHAAHRDNYQPAAVIEQLQESLRVFEDSRFVTAFCARLHRQQRRLQYINAGHPPAILRRRDGSTTLLEATGPLVCAALAEIPAETSVATLEAGDCLLVYTDGLAEADGPHEMFGHSRIRSLVTNSQLSDEALLNQLFAEWTRFRDTCPLSDDVTAMTIELGV